MKFQEGRELKKKENLSVGVRDRNGDDSLPITRLNQFNSSRANIDKYVRKNVGVKRLLACGVPIRFI